jgi:hypothetical protein
VPDVLSSRAFDEEALLSRPPASGSPMGASDTQVLIKEARQRRRRRWLMGMAALCVLAAAAFAGVRLTSPADHAGGSKRPPVRVPRPRPIPRFSAADAGFVRVADNGVRASFTATYLVTGGEMGLPFFQVPGGDGSRWLVTITNQGGSVSPYVNLSTWSFVVQSTRGGPEMQWINRPCSSGGCRPGGSATYVQCLRPDAASAWSCVSGTFYVSNGFDGAITPMVDSQFFWSLPTAKSAEPRSRAAGAAIAYRVFDRVSPVAGGLRCMSAARLRSSGVVNNVITWCVTLNGVPALFSGNHGIPASFQSMRLVLLAPASATLLAPLGTTVPGDALEQVVR